MKNEILEFAEKLNIEYIGIAPVMRYAELFEHLKSRQEKYGLSEFEEKDIEKRANPHLTYPWAKSIIVCLFPYYTGEDEDSNISKYARIPDYHRVAGEKLDKICRLINEKYGTYFFIGYIVTELELESDKPQDKECIKCGKCINACPGQAIDGEFHVDVNRCVSYITQLKTITEEQRKILNNQEMVYGCDRCQDVCPYNVNAQKTPIEEFYKKRVTKLKKSDLETLTNREFKEKYQDFAFSWRGKGAILKNFDK